LFFGESARSEVEEDPVVRDGVHVIPSVNDSVYGCPAHVRAN
jgi:hypothetical protein